MTGFLARLAATGITFIVAAWLVPQIDFKATQLAKPVTDLLQIGGVALVFGLVNAFIKPVVKALAFPIQLMTLGLFSIVINAALLLLVAWFSTKVGVPLHVGTFPPNLLTGDTVVGALLGSVVIGVVGALVGMFVKD